MTQMQTKKIHAEQELCQLFTTIIWILIATRNFFRNKTVPITLLTNELTKGLNKKYH